MSDRTVFDEAFRHPDQSAPRCGVVLRSCVMLLALAIVLMTGCTSTIRTTDPSRTASEQFLLSTAAQRAVEQLSVDGLRGRSVFIDVEYFAASEASFVIGELRAKLMLGGVQLVPTAERAQIVLEVRSEGVGIDRSDFLLGLPSLAFGAGGEEIGRTPLATPEFSIVKNINQRGIASVAYIAYWRDTGEVVAASGPFVGRTFREDWWIFGLGQRTVGDIPPTDPGTD